MPPIDVPFFVHIVESPSDEDLLFERTEGTMLREALKTSRLDASYNLATSKRTFLLAMTARLKSAIDRFQKVPIVHFSMHGNGEGIGLTSGDLITWDELRGYLRPIHAAMNSALIVCLSSCSGAAGARMAMYPNEPVPFWGLVGHPRTVDMADLAVAFVTFYHQIASGALFAHAVEAMKISSGDYGFVFQTGPETQQAYVNFVANLNPQWLSPRIPGAGSI